MKELKSIESSTAVIGNVNLVYIKSEADRCFAWHKYKRCEAMAKWCFATKACYYGEEKYSKAIWYNKWYCRYAQLAEHYKEMAK